MTLCFKNYTHLNFEESQAILALRNEEYIRMHMHNSDMISLENHLKWVDNLKNNNQKEYFALMLDEVIVGSCSWVQDEKGIISWGIFFMQNSHPLVPSLCAYLFMQYLFEQKAFQSVDSQVLKSNSLALKFNQNLGFSLYDETLESYILSLNQSQWEKSQENRFITSLKKYLGKIKYEFQ